MHKNTQLQLKIAAIAASALLATMTAQAATVQNTSGLASPAYTVTFDEAVFAGGTLITTEFSSWGVTLSPALRYNSQGPSAFPGITGNYLGNNGGTFINPFSILFGGDITAAAFGVATNPATSLFEALDNGVVVESFSAATHYDGSTDYYFGFQGITFDEIRVTTGGDHQMLIDNVQLGVAAIPEPETYAMLLAGLGLLGFAARRRKQREAAA